MKRQKTEATKGSSDDYNLFQRHLKRQKTEAKQSNQAAILVSDVIDTADLDLDPHCFTMDEDQDKKLVAQSHQSQMRRHQVPVPHLQPPRPMSVPHSGYSIQNIDDFELVKKKQPDFMQLLESLLVDDDYFLTIAAMAKALEIPLSTLQYNAERYSVNLEDFGLVKKNPRAKKITSEADFMKLLESLPANDYHSQTAMANQGFRNGSDYIYEASQEAWCKLGGLWVCEEEAHGQERSRFYAIIGKSTSG